jgi:hypothetical protein
MRARRQRRCLARRSVPFRPPYGQRATRELRIISAHHSSAPDANIPGRMIVDAMPAFAICRSMLACKSAMGFGCWKNGCGVWCGEERKTTRNARDARRSMTAGTLADAAVQTRKTEPTPSSAASSDSGTQIAGDDVDGLRQRRGIGPARERAHRLPSNRRSTTSRPTRPVAPVTRIRGHGDHSGLSDDVVERRLCFPVKSVT